MTRKAGQSHVCAVQPSRVNVTNLLTTNLLSNEVPVKALIDTGAFVSVFTVNLVGESGWPMVTTSNKLVHAARYALKCIGQVETRLDWKLGGKTKVAVANIPVIENLCADLLLGFDLLKRFKVSISVSDDVDVRFQKERKGVSARENTVLPPKSVNLIRGDVGDVDLTTILASTTWAEHHSISTDLRSVDIE